MADEEKSLKDLQEEQKSLQKEQENLINKQSELSKKQQKTTEDLAAAQKELADANKSLANKLKSAEKSISDLQNQGYNLSMFLSDASGKGKKFLIESTENNLKEIEKEQKQKEEYNKVISELTSKEQEIIKQANEKIKNLKKENELSKKEQLDLKIKKEKNETKQKENIEQITRKSIEKQNSESSFRQLINQLKSGKSDIQGLDWKLDRRVNAFNSLLSGNFKYGATQFLQTFERGKILLNHPMVMFGVAVEKFLIAAIDFSTKTDRLANKIAGGSLVSPEMKSRKWEMSAQDYALAIMYGQNKEDLYKFKIGSFGALTKKRLAEDSNFTHAWSFGRAAMEDLGGNPDLINSFMQQQVAIGRSSNSIEKFNYKLVKTITNLDKLSTDQFMSSFNELNKTLIANNINGTANAKSLLKFQDALNRGTLSVSDFAKGLTSRRGAETSTLAGVGIMLAERGLGNKELQDAYARGDMIAVAGAVRRGGQQMQRDIEKIAPEIAEQIGTSDLQEALAMQSNTPWGQMTGDLKKLDVQNILSKGGSLVINIDSKDLKLNQEQQQEFLDMQSELMKTSIDNKGALEALGQGMKLGALQLAAAYEKAQNAEEERRKSLDLNTAAMNDLTDVLKLGPKYNNPTML